MSSGSLFNPGGGGVFATSPEAARLKKLFWTISSGSGVPFRIGTARLDVLRGGGDPRVGTARFDVLRGSSGEPRAGTVRLDVLTTPPIPPVHVDTTTGVGPSGSVALPTGIQTGDLLVLCAGTVNATVSTPTGFTERIYFDHQTGDRLKMATRIVDGTEADPVTWTSTAGEPCAVVLSAFRNIASDTPTDTDTDSITSRTDLASTANNGIALVCGYQGSSSTALPNTSFSNATLLGTARSQEGSEVAIGVAWALSDGSAFTSVGSGGGGSLAAGMGASFL